MFFVPKQVKNSTGDSKTIHTSNICFLAPKHVGNSTGGDSEIASKSIFFPPSIFKKNQTISMKISVLYTAPHTPVDSSSCDILVPFCHILSHFCHICHMVSHFIIFLKHTGVCGLQHNISLIFYKYYKKRGFNDNTSVN
jgi:hypothetical protein